MKKWLKITLSILLVIGVTSLLAFVSSLPKSTNCYNVQVKIKGDPEALFVTESEIVDKFTTVCTTRPSDQPLDLKEAESQINQIPAVKKSEIYKNVNGNITIEVELRTVIGRVINKTGDSFYIDEEGVMMPIVEDRPARVCVVNGEIIEEYTNNPYYLNDDSLAARSVMDDAYRMLSFIHHNTFWKAEIEQMYITHEKKFILIPKMGTHEIMFGEATHIEGKFKKLELFYKSAINRVGWEKYKTIDVQYKGQVIGIGNEEAYIPVIVADSVATNSNNNGQTEPE